MLLVTLPFVRRLPPFDNKPDNRPTWLKLLRLDWISILLTIGFVTCLGVGLQWGGVSKSWKDGGVIAVGQAEGIDITLTSFRCWSWRPPSSRAFSCGH